MNIYRTLSPMRYRIRRVGNNFFAQYSPFYGLIWFTFSYSEGAWKGCEVSSENYDHVRHEFDKHFSKIKRRRKYGCDVENIPVTNDSFV